MYSDNWTQEFLIDKYKSFNNVQSIEPIDNNTLKIIRKKGASFCIFSMSLDNIEFNVVREICERYNGVNIIKNIKKKFKISGKAIDYLQERNITIGGTGDFMRFCNQQSNDVIIDKEYDFIRRSLKQHTKVKSLERLDNRRILIKRYNLEDVIAIMVNDYEISVESVRSAKELFKDFKVIMKTNPNGGISSEAINVANSLNIEICKWGDFLGKLNSQWN